MHTDDGMADDKDIAFCELVLRQRGLIWHVCSDYSLSAAWEVEDAFQEVLLVAWERLSGEVRLDYSHVEGDSYSRDFFDLGFRAEYKWRRWRLQLRSGNILNLGSTDWIATTATHLYLSTTTYRRLPGYLLAGLVYRH